MRISEERQQILLKQSELEVSIYELLEQSELTIAQQMAVLSDVLNRELQYKWRSELEEKEDTEDDINEL